MADADLLALLHGAVGRTSTLSGELRCWRHVARSQRAFEVARETSPSPMGTMLHYVGGGQPPEEGETVWRVVQAAGGRYRWDEIAQTGAYTGAALPGSQGCDGERAWHAGPDTVHITRPRGCVLERRLLDPSWVLTHDLDVTGREESSGRAVLRVRAVARPTQPRSGGAPEMATERDLVVDAERGFLHRDTALVDGEPYDTMELRALVLDEDVDQTIFAPQVPPGYKVMDMSEDLAHPLPWERDRRRRHLRWPIARW